MAAQFFHHQLVSGLASHFEKSQTQRLRGRKEWFKIQGIILQENIEGNENPTNLEKFDNPSNIIWK